MYIKIYSFDKLPNQDGKFKKKKSLFKNELRLPLLQNVLHSFDKRHTNIN
jgi:hypothetical protein